ncbi:MAG: PQQ-like beta-propeller repeat protein [Verrucomicrobia bacterium]|nr:PQQ-like beta-propeller repeat protein [Verrucomicrobiota bacterium]
MRLTCLAAVSLAAISTNLSAADWPQWRGPQRDGVIRGEKPLDKLPSAPRKIWEIPAGSGHSAVVISGNRFVYIDQGGEPAGTKEVVHLCDLATGKELWKNAYAEMADYYNYGTGPRTTPVIDGDRLYVQSGRGEFQCLKLADGKKIWSVNFEKDYGANYFGNKGSDPAAKETAARRHGNNGAPVIDGSRVFVPVGSPEKGTLVAFDKLTGKELWHAGSDNTAYSSLMVGTLAGTRQVVHFTADALMGVDAEKGKVLWRVPIKTGAKRHTFTPLIVGDTVTIASQTVGLIRYQIAKAGAAFTATPMWENKETKVNISSMVLVNGKLYGIGAGGNKTDFTCVDFATGKTLWTHPGFADYASTLALGDKLLALNSDGELHLIAADPTAYKEISRMQPCGKTYSFPAYLNGVLYVRDEKTIRALAMGEAPLP